MASKNQFANVTAEEIIQHLHLVPHPEGGFYKETFRDERNSAGQAHSTAIYFMMKKGTDMVWHRVRGKNEVWHFYAGDPLEVRIATPDGIHQKPTIFGPDILRGQQPQLLIRADHWQSATCLGEWTLFGCTVSPGFEFENFEVAPEGWQPAEIE